MQRRHFCSLLLTPPLTSGLLLAPAAARAQNEPREGREFSRLATPQPVQVAGKIEVLEFFSYACPHCNAFEPELEAWAAKLPADVVFRRVPVNFLANAAVFQRSYYALESLGLVGQLQRKVFAAVHVEHQRLGSPEEVAALVAKHGGDSAKFIAAYQSFSVAGAVNKAKKMTTEYGVDTGPGVPALVVQGRYLTSPAQAGGHAQALATVDGLIAKARKG